jgi:hypothetical protein
MSELISGDAGRIGFLLKGDYSADATYDFLDVVYSGGASYVAKKETKGNPPSENSEYWQILARGGAEGDFASKAIYGDDAVSLGRKEGTVVGEKSFTFGNNLDVTGRKSMAIGDTNIVAGINSFSGGYNNKTSGNNSISFGSECNAMGYGSMALGSRLASVNDYCFSEGCGNIALGYGSHVENCQNIAGAKYIFKIESYDAVGKKFTFDDTYIGFADAFAALSIGEKLFIQNFNFINTALIFTVHSIESDGKSIVVEEDIPSSKFIAHFATIIQPSSNYYSCHAEGRNTIAAGNECSHAEGYATEALGFCSHTEGRSTKATGSQSHAEGFETVASGGQSHAEGYKTEARGNYSHAGGYYSIANGNFQMAIGRYNSESETGGNGDFFIIGAGSSPNSRSNAFRISNAGSVYAKGNYNSSGADYAEFIRPWADGNPDNEDRVGYFVTIKDGYLYKAEADDYIVGITSGNPSVVGNSDEEYYWRWERDEFNRVVYEEVEEYTEKFDEEGNPVLEDGKPIMIPTGRMEKRMKQAAGYDGSLQQSYVERKDRPEWDYVGMIGVVPVRDDGTCVAGSYCRCGTGGIATLADMRGFDTYMVLERIADNIVSVILK